MYPLLEVRYGVLQTSQFTTISTFAPELPTPGRVRRSRGVALS